MQNNIKTEILAVVSRWQIWWLLGFQDIRMRYRRSSIGPFWITISMAVTIYSMGFLYSHLLKSNINQYFPYLAASIIGWSLISTIVTEAGNIFIESEVFIRNQQIALSTFVMRALFRNMIIFLHNIVVIVPIVIFFHVPFGLGDGLLLVGLAVVCLNGFFWGTLLAVIGTRYRDFSQIVVSLVQVIFFVTPIMWMPSLLSERLQWVVRYNPFNQILNLIRDPILYHRLPMMTFLISLAVTVLGGLLYCVVMSRCRHRIVFWL